MMLDDLTGRSAFVTGAASGIGLATAQALARAGVRVVMADINAADLEAAVAATTALGGAAHAITLDVRAPESWKEAAARTAELVGDLHILFSNAGVGSGTGLVEQRTVEDFDMVWGVNVRGMFLGVRTFLSGMKAHGQPGHVVVTASAMGLFCRPHTGIYSMSKYAALALGETLYLELRGTPLGASVLCPGAVNTALVTNVARLLPSKRGQETNEADTNFLASGMSAEQVASSVLKAIGTGAPYIITHPEYRALVADREEVLMAAFEVEVDPATADDLSGYATYTGRSLAGPR